MNQNRPTGLSPEGEKTMRVLAAALGAGIAICGTLILMDGYETGNEARKRYGINLVLAGGNIVRMTPEALMEKLAPGAGSEHPKA